MGYGGITCNLDIVSTLANENRGSLGRLLNFGWVDSAVAKDLLYDKYVTWW